MQQHHQDQRHRQNDQADRLDRDTAAQLQRFFGDQAVREIGFGGAEQVGEQKLDRSTIRIAAPMLLINCEMRGALRRRSGRKAISSRTIPSSPPDHRADERQRQRDIPLDDQQQADDRAGGEIALLARLINRAR